MENNVFGLILNVEREKMGNTANIEILGKSMLQWVSVALGDIPHSDINSVGGEVVKEIKPFIRKDSDYTVVLYSDTPLITKKTVGEAIAMIKETGGNVLKMSRGYVFKTSFLSLADKIYSENISYFDEEDFITAFNFRQLGLITDIMKNRILAFHMEQGVHFEDMSSAYIGCDVVIGKSVVIAPNNVIKGKTIIKDNVKILSNNVIEDCIIDEGAVINSSQLYKSYVGKETTVGPYAFIRPDSVIGANCRIGDFVEIKKSIIGDGSKVSHLTYVGDCEMGGGCNIGCGVVFANYDGKNKFQAKVGNNVFIGSNANILAPVVIEDGAFVAAGSTITENVPQNALAIARARQVIKTDWDNNNFTNHKPKN